MKKWNRKRKRTAKARIKLQELQEDPTLKPSISTVGLRPKQFVDQYDYHVMKQDKVQYTNDDRYIGQYSMIEQQIRADAILSRQIYEEWKQFAKQIKQLENKDPINIILIQCESRQSLINLIL